MSTSAKSPSNFFHRLNAYLPWAKFAAVIVISVIALLDLLSFTISKTSNLPVAIQIAPMLIHPKLNERNLKNRQLVALTFDDGPSRATTLELLDILQEKQVPATFFVLGKLAATNPDIVKRAESEGHEIGSHTMNHQNLNKLSAFAAVEEVTSAAEVIEDALGHAPKYLRPPYGNHPAAVDAAANAPIILWSVDTLDWKYRNTDSIVDLALKEVSEGAIILMHDIYASTVEAVPVLIDTLRENGYEFVTLSELSSYHNHSLSNGETYYRISKR